MSERSSALLLRVFTHPACGKCGVAVADAWQVSEARPELSMRTVSLSTREGLAEAHREGIRTIPTVILSFGDAELRRWVGTPGDGELAEVVAQVSDGLDQVVAS